ncbi:DUF2125 domain-containing protein [Roseivivax marinus]|uniref:DUF2125 domain-containing protein n=1 Tax=Roseivivax marinus TaxID=1379903 RepID=UPI00273DA467|nr:DUF2125 domain-containing protein [Roseivivax marinus]
MIRSFPHAGRIAGLALACLTAPQAVFADVAPGEVWSMFRDYLVRSGYEVTAEEAETGGDLRVSDVTLRMEAPDETGGVLVVTMDEILFEDAGDGTVSVVLPGSIPAEISGMEDDDVEAVRFEIMQTALDIAVSGTPDDMVWDYTADAASVRLAELVRDGAPVSREDAAATVALEEMSGRTSIATARDGGQEIAQTVEAARMTYDLAFAEPAEEDDAEGADAPATEDDEGAAPDRFALSGRAQDVRITADSALPEEGGADEMAALLDDGFRVGFDMTYSDGETEFTGQDASGTSSGRTASNGGSLSLSLGEDGLSYDVRAEGMAYAITMGDLPIPFTAEAEEMRTTLQVPVMPSDAPQDFSLALALRGVTASEMLWSMIDPDEALPRDPATVALELTGTAAPGVNMFDTEAIEAMQAEGRAPGTFDTLEIAELQVSAAGAELTGEGSFTFDEDDLETFDGMPAPEGSATLTLSGATALLDTLVSMGIVGQDEAMGARMMLSMFAVPGDGEDTLTTTIEVTEEGHVRANGQRIR